MANLDTSKVTIDRVVAAFEAMTRRHSHMTIAASVDALRRELPLGASDPRIRLFNQLLMRESREMEAMAAQRVRQIVLAVLARPSSRGKTLRKHIS